MTQTTFNDLYDHTVICNVMGYNAGTTTTDDIYRISDQLSIQKDKLLKSFINHNPMHPVSLFNKPLLLSDGLAERKTLANTKLWQKYLELKKDKSPADDEYFDLFDIVIALNQEACLEVGIDPIEVMYFNDPIIGDYNTIMGIVSRMAGISKQFINEGWNNGKNIDWQGFQGDYIQNVLFKYLDTHNIQYTVSDKNGSFMSAIDKDTARIHISDKESVVNMKSSVYHEAGHALYQTKVLSKNTDVGKLGGCISLSLHESSSIIFERQYDCFNGTVSHNTNNGYRLRADKIHYVLHIYIRMKIEEMLFNNEIKARDIPKIWNKLMVDIIGITPENDWRGFLQDVHWSSGAFGYFHSYAIGFFNAMTMPDITNHNKDKTNAIISCIDGWYGKYNEYSFDIINDMHPCLDSSFKAYKESIKDNFNMYKYK